MSNQPGGINAAALLMDRGSPSGTAIVRAERRMSWAELPLRGHANDVAPTPSILGMLKVLRRGGTAMLCGARRASAAPVGARELPA